MPLLDLHNFRRLVAGLTGLETSYFDMETKGVCFWHDKGDWVWMENHIGAGAARRSKSKIGSS